MWGPIWTVAPLLTSAIHHRRRRQVMCVNDKALSDQSVESVCDLCGSLLRPHDVLLYCV